MTETLDNAQQSRRRLRSAAAGLGAGALLTMGLLGTALAGSPVSTGTVEDLPEATVGDTTTQSPGSKTLETSIATPAIKAQVPDGYGQTP